MRIIEHNGIKGLWIAFKASCLQIRNGVTIAAGLLLITLFLSFFLMQSYPEIIENLMHADRWKQLQTEIEQIFTVQDQGAINSFFRFLRIFGHNVLLGFLAFTGGSLLGIVSIYLLLFNGMIMGVIFALLIQNHGPGGLHSTVILHGIPEIMALTGCAGAGFHLAGRLFFKKGMLKREAIKNAFNAGILVFAGMIFWFGMAAILEVLLANKILRIHVRINAAYAILWILLFIRLFFYKTRKES